MDSELLGIADELFEKEESRVLSLIEEIREYAATLRLEGMASLEIKALQRSQEWQGSFLQKAVLLLTSGLGLSNIRLALQNRIDRIEDKEEKFLDILAMEGVLLMGEGETDHGVCDVLFSFFSEETEEKLRDKLGEQSKSIAERAAQSYEKIFKERIPEYQRNIRYTVLQKGKKVDAILSSRGQDASEYIVEKTDYECMAQILLLVGDKLREDLLANIEVASADKLREEMNRIMAIGAYTEKERNDRAEKALDYACAQIVEWEVEEIKRQSAL